LKNAKQQSTDTYEEDDMDEDMDEDEELSYLNGVDANEVRASVIYLPQFFKNFD
jgi:hypothetical protein